MLEQAVIQQRGFRNVGGSPPSGFQVAVRCPYYRGIWATLLEDVELAVDGESFPSEAIAWTLGGRTFRTAELQEASEARWAFEEPALLTVDKPDGLAPGLHHVRVAITWRWSYIPIEMQPTTSISERRLVLVA